MIYPELIFTGEHPNMRCDAVVFEDIKLDGMIREDICELMRTLCSKEDIKARNEIFVSLDDRDIFTHYRALAATAETMEELDEIYSNSRCDAERNFIFLMLMHSLSAFAKTAAAGCAEGRLYTRFSNAFSEYIKEPIFLEFSRRADELYSELAEIRANVYHIEGEHLSLTRGACETYASVIRRCAVGLGVEKLPDEKKIERTLTVDTIEALKGLYPAHFARLSEFYDSYNKQYSGEICKYRVQLDFYIQIKLLINKISSFGIPIRYPEITDERIIDIKNAYDVTLLTKEELDIIPNDISFSPEEPFFYLTGANGGGKTTYLRTVGVALMLALTGCPIPCESAKLCTMNRIFTHFPRDERFDNTGRFVDEEKRISEMLSVVDSRCMVLLNETYSTTNEETASRLTAELAEKLWNLGVYGIYITHQHKLTSESIPYLNVVVDSDDNNRRTYKVAKRKASEGSYARDILAKYGLTADRLHARFGGAR